MTTVARHAGTVIEDAIRRRESIRDPLTGLYNRRHFKEKVRDEIARASRHDETMAVLLCDLDRFKQINDTRGHQVGDAVLRSVATTICGATRGTDLHFRWGGDEIVVILSKTSEEGVLVVAERIRQAIAVYAESSGFDLDASIGIALYPQHGTHEDELVRAADLAMYVAKKSGDKVRVGIDEYAIDEECVSFVYQPVVTVESGEVLGHEVFTRDPDGQLSPLELFKKYHAVGQLGRLKRVIFELQIRQARFAGVRCLFLNADMDFLKRMDPVPVPSNLEVVVEVSELDRNTDEEDRIHAFRKWRRAGYRFAIDDFGAGYVSLALLSKLKPDYIKLDRSSIVQAVESTKFAEFLRHLLRAASEYATRGIIAEGIENRADLDTAKSLGVDFAQGFLLGRPSRVPEGSAITAHENLETA
jgi:diguanylate cyclase (GGDEF)-like protein